MKHPTELEFLEALDIEPIEKNVEESFYRFLLSYEKENTELEFSFSGVEDSFQVILRTGGRTIALISSEKAEEIEILEGHHGPFLKILFQIEGFAAQATLHLLPLPYCEWTLITT